MNCCICGPVKNCGPFLDKIFENMEKIGSLFDDYEIIIYYDKSDDNTLEKLKKYSEKNTKMKFFVNTQKTYSFRTHNIAKARNFCLNYVKKNLEKYPYFIMMDCDDVNCKNCDPEILRKYLNRDDWDALSFNSSPKYYDVWGLSIHPYCFSYNHFENNVQFYYTIQDYISSTLNSLQEGELLPCISSFNGFSIYKTNAFLETFYDGRIRIDLIPQKNLFAHQKISNSSIVYKKYVTSDCRYEDCEHRAFHIQATQNSGARIMISPEVIFQ
jgi:glycosyltransferase involved in cell wall biosynthesis